MSHPDPDTRARIEAVVAHVRACESANDESGETPYWLLISQNHGDLIRDIATVVCDSVVGQPLPAGRTEADAVAELSLVVRLRWVDSSIAGQARPVANEDALIKEAFANVMVALEGCPRWR